MKNKILIILTIITLLFSNTVFAAKSPTAQKYYLTTFDNLSITEKTNVISTQTGEIKTNVSVNNDGIKVIVLEYISDNNYNFFEWVIEGDYELKSGSIQSNSISIIPKEDIVIKVKVLDGNNNVIIDSKVKNIENLDNSMTSPITGYNELVINICYLTIFLSFILICGLYKKNTVKH